MNLLTVSDAARRRQVSERRIRQFIAEGRLKAEKVGRDWLVDPSSLAALEALKRGPKPKGKRRA